MSTRTPGSALPAGGRVAPPAEPGLPGTVFLVEDDASYLRATARMLRVAGFRVVGFDSAAAFLAGVEAGAAGCLIADLQMPGMDGLALQERLLAAGYGLPILFLTGQGDIPACARAMRRGAEDFLTKQAGKAELLEAVGRALARDEANRRERARVRALRAPFERLTAREREVLRHVLQGWPNKRIAAELGIHERTVKLHRTGITSKLKVGSVAELTRRAQEAGVVGRDAEC